MNKEEFINSLKELNVEITEDKLEKLEIFYNLLIEENKKYNLTSITEKEQVYLKHFFDSLTLNKIIKLGNQSLCDIGTGAGFPGVVLKIMFPNLKVALIESTGKKCHFLSIVKKECKLNNLEIINERAEIYAKNNREQFDIVTSRAVAPLKHLLEYSIPLVNKGGYYVAMKANIDNEVTNIENYYNKLKIKLIDVIKFNLPKENSIRTLLLYKKIETTPLLYPRKYNDIKKKEI